jgi:hypothetical protein
MTITSQKLKAQLTTYKAFYSNFKLELVHDCDFLAHEAVERLIGVQFKGVNNIESVNSITRKLKKFIRDIKVELNCMYIKFDKLNYPDFLHELAEVKVKGALSSYHSLIVDLLKIIIIKINDFDKGEESENKVYEYVLTLIKSDPPIADKQKILFADDEDIENNHDDTDIDDLILTLDKFL